MFATQSEISPQFIHKSVFYTHSIDRFKKKKKLSSEKSYKIVMLKKTKE